MTSGCSATSSFANRCINSASAGVAQRVSIRMLRPSVHPSFWSPSRNAAIKACRFRVALGKAHQHADPSHPLGLLRARRERPRATAPPRRMMNSRRRISSPKLRGQHCIGSDKYFDRGSNRHQPMPQCTANVRFGSLADICNANRHVRFTPNSGHYPLAPAKKGT